MTTTGIEMPDELSPRHLRTRLLQLAAVVVVLVVLVLVGPGLDGLRSRLSHASAGWLIAGAFWELLSALSYVLVFRGVFCPRMGWRLSYQIGIAEQAANSLLPAGGAGGLALGAWALRRGGMSAEHIGRRTVAFFLLTSLANVGTLIVFAVLFLVGAVQRDPSPVLTYGFAGAGLLVTAAVLWLGSHSASSALERQPTKNTGRRVVSAIRRARSTIGAGVRDSLVLLRQRSLSVLAGSFGYMAFDIAVLWACFRAFGHSPAFGVLVVAYLIGQLGGLLPLPGGLGGIEGGLIGTFALYGTPLASATAAVLAYRVLALWIPGLLGSVGFIQLRRTLHRVAEPAAVCTPLAEPLQAAAAIRVAP